jgi:hypothetical protein
VQERFSLARAVELQVNYDEIEVVLWPKDLVPANAGSLAVRGVAIECLLPSLEVRNGVLDPYDWHF